MRTADHIQFEENQEPDLDDAEEDILQSNNMRSPSNYSENSIPTHSQTKSASKGKKKKAEWNDQEVQSLILLQSRFEVLFTTKHPIYYNKKEKGKTLKNIKEGLVESSECSFSTKDVAEKNANLRNYSWAQRRIVEPCWYNEINESSWMITPFPGTQKVI